PSAHPGIHFIPGVYATQRVIGECPLACVKTISLIDECRRVLALAQLAPKCRLPSICVSGPFVNGQHPGKSVQVSHPVHHLHRQIVEHLPFQRTYYVPRSELQSRLAPDGASGKLDVQLWSMLDQPITDFNHLSSRDRQLSALGQPRCQKLIRQNPQMLWIVTEFHHVEISVGAAHQMSLRPAPHPPHVLDSDYSHIRWLRSRSAAQSAPSYPESLFLDVTDEHRQNSPLRGKLARSMVPTDEILPARSRLAARAIAIAITQSSCAPPIAADFPSACLTKVRNSFSRRRLRNNSGSSASTAARVSTIAGRLTAEVNHPSCSPCRYTCR